MKTGFSILREGELLFDVFTIQEEDIATIVEAVRSKLESHK
jgi:hypothetical protein